MDAVIVESTETATACVIWLHGLGASGHDFEPIVPALDKQITKCTRFIFPHAPQRPVTINGNMVMRAWYDIAALDLTSEQDENGTRISEQIICEYIAEVQQQGIDNSRIILAGFSQGGAIALHTGLRYPKPLGGIMALSTYLPIAETVSAERHTANANVQIFMGHGTFDNVIPIKYADLSKQYLENLGYTVDWHSYTMEHQVIPQEINDINQWLVSRLT